MSGSPDAVRASVRLSFVSTIVTGFIQFAMIAVLARLLNPAEYGVFALGMAIGSLSSILVTNFIERGLVVRPGKESERDLSLSILLICLVAGAVGMLMGVAWQHFGRARIDLGVLAVIMLWQMLNGLAIMPRVSLRRQIRFGAVLGAEFGGVIIGPCLTAGTLAALGFGAYSLAIGNCVQALVLILVLRSKWDRLPLAVPRLRDAWEVLRSSAMVGGSAITEVINGQLPPLVLGALLGTVPVGLFNRSYSVVQMPIQLLISSMNRVMISALFGVREDLVSLRRASRSMVRVAAIMVTPIAAGIAGAAHPFALVTFGAKWGAAGDIMGLFAVAAWAAMMGTLLAIVAEATYRFADKIRTQTISTVLLGVALVIGCWRMGLWGAVAGLMLSSLVFLLLFARLAARLLGVRLRTVLSWLLPGVIVALPCFAVSMAIDHFLDRPAIIVLACQILACGILDFAGTILFFPRLALQIVQGAAPAALRLLPSLNHLLKRERRAFVLEGMLP